MASKQARQHAVVETFTESATLSDGIDSVSIDKAHRPCFATLELCSGFPGTVPRSGCQCHPRVKKNHLRTQRVPPEPRCERAFRYRRMHYGMWQVRPREILLRGYAPALARLLREHVPLNVGFQVRSTAKGKIENNMYMLLLADLTSCLCQRLARRHLRECRVSLRLLQRRLLSEPSSALERGMFVKQNDLTCQRRR
jgi:hypothetical protein